MSHSINLGRIKAVAKILGDLKDEVVFVGGATVSLYADRMALEVRPTEDVDILVELYTRAEYAKLEEKLRQRGFVNDTASKFIGRYIMQGLVVDVMPVSEEILGFSNIWYAEGYKASIDYVVDAEMTVRIFTAPYFIASKLQAFKNRGKNDGIGSSDFEDIIFVLENRLGVWDEMQASADSLQHYLKVEFGQLLNNENFEEWVNAHESFRSPSSTYYIMHELEKFVNDK